MTPPTVYHMKEDGWVKISATNVARLYYAYKEGEVLPHSTTNWDTSNV